MRERVRVLSDDAYRMALTTARCSPANPNYDTPENHYGYALALTRSGQGSQGDRPVAAATWQVSANIWCCAWAWPMRAAGRPTRCGIGHLRSAQHAIAAQSSHRRGLRQRADPRRNVAQAASGRDAAAPMLEDTDEPDIFPPTPAPANGRRRGPRRRSLCPGQLSLGPAVRCDGAAQDACSSATIWIITPAPVSRPISPISPRW
jgi:hypothetical protein